MLRRDRRKEGGRIFVVQQHAARRMHYDLRLELDGVLKSWAVPKGPSLDPAERRLAVHVEDHPLEYGDFEGVIPEGEYGAGPVIVWDRGVWTPEGDPVKGYTDGNMKFRLNGRKLRGGWRLVRTGGLGAGSGRRGSWLLIKSRDAAAVRGAGDRLVAERPESVVSGLTLDEVEAAAGGAGGAGVEAEGAGIAAAARRSVDGAPGRPDPGSVAGARAAAFPEVVRPQLATAVEDAPEGEGWLHELKLDGYRLLCSVRGGRVRLVTRNGKDWTGRFRRLARESALLPVEEALVDGEAVVLGPRGVSSFQAMQNALAEGRDRDIVYFAFDLLYLDGHDLRGAALVERKALLEAVLERAAAGVASPEAWPIRYSGHVVGRGPEVYREACALGAEGIISKRTNRRYREGRSRDWLKVKCVRRQEFVVVGWTDPGGGRQGLGSLLLGYYDEGGDLRYAGRVGTGFTARSLASLRALLDPLARASPPVHPVPAGARGRDAHWVQPRLVAEVAYAEWTRDGVLRHPSFKGLREDIDPREVGREPESGAAPSPAPARGRPARGRAVSGPDRVAGVRLTRPDRVYYPDTGVTKHDLARYYESVAEWIVPHLADRLLTLVRCPEGHTGDCFYQKHADPSFPPSVRRVPVREEKKTRTYMAVDSVEGVVALVQLGALEFHTWGGRTDRLDRPDRLIFDLDPGPGVAWEALATGARLVRDRLDELGLVSYVKTTGGKGLHVIAPIVRRSGWDEVKSFARAVAAGIARAEPDRYTDRMARDARRGKIYIDYLRNSRGATAVAAYSSRARPGAPVSAPVRWDELRRGLRSDRFTVENMPGRLAAIRRDPWEGFAQVRQSITAAMRKDLGIA